MVSAAVPGADREQRLEQWITEYADAVLRTCFVYLSDAALAEDAMQDTF
jgi:DNA-directed RNA polymerase specialized sigma24 family protein